LISIIKDNIRLEQHRGDPEMQEDMLYQLAKSYSHTPDLRLAVFERLSEHHAKLSYFAEAGISKLHCAALVAEYLRHKQITSGVPDGSKAFRACNDSILEDVAFRNCADQKADIDDVCQSTAFSESGLVEYCQQAIDFLRKGQLFETAAEVYKLLIPISEKVFQRMYNFNNEKFYYPHLLMLKSQNYEELVRIYDQMRSIYQDIVNSMSKRIFATYYRVSFYGSKFGAALDGQEFLYKERTVTPLADIVARLSDIYRKRFGDDFVLLNDATKVNRAELDPKKVFFGMHDYVKIGVKRLACLLL
jgi:hypothetical protein